MEATQTRPLIGQFSAIDRPLIQAVAVLTGAFVTALAAQVQVPWQPVPFTLQTLVVMACGLTLGMRLGMMSQLLYLAVGLAGFPVFAQFRAGLPALLGPTGGYLLAFVLMAGLLGWVAERGWDRKVLPLALSLVVSTMVVYALGTTWLSFFTGSLASAWMAGAAPFLVTDALKIMIACGAFPGAWALLSRFTGRPA